MKHRLTGSAQALRKGQTKEEATLWYRFLRQYSPQFRRQHPIGQYIVDFYCAKAKLVIELDGSQHYDAQGMEYDNVRTEFLESRGLKVIRFSNADIHLQFRNVCMAIDLVVKSRSNERD